MARTSNWSDDYWLLLLQLYLRKPVGIKPMYSRAMVELAMELHIAPQILFSRMGQLAALQTPRIERIWEQYGDNPRRLSRAVRLLRDMKGYGNADDFYEGVEVNESFEKDFRPVSPDSSWTPVALILILDLYFRLTPQTMVAATPEIQELRIKTKPGLLPPFYYEAQTPETIEEVQESEKRYLEAYLEAPFKTDWKYFWGIVGNILFHRKRSK